MPLLHGEGKKRVFTTACRDYSVIERRVHLRLGKMTKIFWNTIPNNSPDVERARRYSLSTDCHIK